LTESPRPALVEGHAFEALDWHEVTVEGADWAIEMAVTPRVVNSSGALQGGLLATLADMVAGTALMRGSDPYVRSATTEMHVSFLEAARQGPVVATAYVLRRGRRTAVVRVDVRDRSAGDILVATATLSFAVRRAEGA
jgi:uncharacterized protein (TIGR00369 family)